jgi:hypothetical protein
MTTSLARRLGGKGMAQVMTWRWARLLSGLAGYALAFWGGLLILSAATGLLESPRLPFIDTIVLMLFGIFLIGALAVVYRLGAWVGSRLWLLAPVLAIVLPAFAVPVAGQRFLGWPSDSGWVFVIIYGLVALLPAALGIQKAFDGEDAPLGREIRVRKPGAWAVPATLAGVVILVLGLASGAGIAVIIGLILFLAGAAESGAWGYASARRILR